MKIERVQIMLTEEELAALDEWLLARRLPSRPAAVRELLLRSLAAEGATRVNGQIKPKVWSITAKNKKTSSGTD